MKETGKIHPSGVIFDMDGLMLDTEAPAIPLWAKAARPYGYDISPAVVLRTIGIDTEGSGRIFTGEYGADFPFESVRDDFRLLLMEEFDKGITQKPGLGFLLDRLDSLGIPLAVATSTRRESALWKLQKGGIEGRFAAMVCGDEIKRGKPAPDIFLLAAEKLGKKPSDCVGFEDSSPGLRGLYDAGIRSVFVKDLVTPPPEVLALAWRVFPDLAQAAEIFA